MVISRLVILKKIVNATKCERTLLSQRGKNFSRHLFLQNTCGWLLLTIEAFMGIFWNFQKFYLVSGWYFVLYIQNLASLQVKCILWFCTWWIPFIREVSFWSRAFISSSRIKLIFMGLFHTHTQLKWVETVINVRCHKSTLPMWVIYYSSR